MRTNFTPLLRRGLLFSGLALASLSLYNCSSKDLEFIDPYEFVIDEFDDVEYVPVADPEPVFDDPDTGQVAPSDDVQAIITDVMGATAPEEIDPSTTAASELINNFGEGLTPEVVAIAEGLDSDGAAAILNTENELDPALVALAEELENAPIGVQNLLPSIDFSCTTAEVQAAVRAALKGQIFPGIKDQDVVSQSTLFGPCVDAAEEAYDAAIADVVVERDANIALINDNEAARLTEAETRLDTRLTAQEANYDTNEAEILATVEALLAAEVAAETLGDTALADSLRLLALFTAVDGRGDLQDWNSQVIACLEATLAQEIAEIQQLADDRLAQVAVNFDAATAEADAALAESLNNCHNQGAGN